MEITLGKLITRKYNDNTISYGYIDGLNAILKQGLKSGKLVLNIKRIVDKLNSEFNIYCKASNELNKSYAVKDIDGKPIVIDGLCVMSLNFFKDQSNAIKEYNIDINNIPDYNQYQIELAVILDSVVNIDIEPLKLSSIDKEEIKWYPEIIELLDLLIIEDKE